MLHISQTSIYLLLDQSHSFFINRLLTMKPPPRSPPKYCTSGVMCPSLTYLTSQPGKNNTMLQMMDISTNGYRDTPMQREQLPEHMVSEWKLLYNCVFIGFLVKSFLFFAETSHSELLFLLIAVSVCFIVDWVILVQQALYLYSGREQNQYCM